MLDIPFLMFAAFFAGLVDAVVGGGGLIQIPTLFAIYPAQTAATLVGTNKLSAVFGTAVAAAKYAGRVRVAWSTAGPAAVAAFGCAMLGAWTLTRVPSQLIRGLLPLVLLGVAVYTFRKKDLGAVHAPAHSGVRERVFAVMVGAAIGFYDGFFGPGTGSFLIFLFVRFFGFDFLHASAAAKIVNVTCNVSALMWFGWSGHLLWHIGAAMAVAQVAGALVGTRLALRYGSGFVRRLFLLVVAVLIVKTAYTAMLGLLG